MVYEDFELPELLPPSEDGVFKTLLTHPDAKPILRDVVESFLRFPVVKVEVRNVEMPIADINEKRERFDVNCTVNDGSQLDVEMQSESISGDSAVTNHKIVKSRAIYHLCDLHSGQSGRSIRYDKLMRSFQMTFCGYSVFPERNGFVRRFSFRDEAGEELSDAVGIIFVELTRLGDVMKKPVDAMTGEELWSVFFAHGSDPKHKELLDKMIAARSEIKMARELLQTISRDEDERARFRARRKFQMDMEHSLIVARDEGELSKAMAIAKNAINMNLATDMIVKLTGLTSEEVEGLRVAN
jgi:predicted transposase/invertase (TIGR01784 family)